MSRRSAGLGGERRNLARTWFAREAREARTASSADVLSGRLRLGHPRVEGVEVPQLRRRSMRS
jgi:hypothetical protein